MSDYREIEIIVNVFGKDNIMTDEMAGAGVIRITITVSELVTADEVMKEINKRISSIEDVL